MKRSASDRGIPHRASDDGHMQRALEEARAAGALGEIPVGALVIDSAGSVIGVGRNSREEALDPTAHAEINAIREAATAAGNRILDGCTLVVTLEPCAMCAGTILAARIPRVVFGAWDDKAGASGSVYDLLRDGRLPHPVPEVVAGVREAESAQLLEAFFAQRR